MAARLTAYAVAFIVGVTLIAGLIVGAQREDDGPVDLIVINGKVFAADGGTDLADAVAVRGNKVVRIGRVVASGNETEFRFSLKTRPEKVTLGLLVMSTNRRVRNCSRRRNTRARLYGLPGRRPR